jgi:DNA mismatch repair protein MSH5
MSQVGCAGALLTYLKRRRVAEYLPGDDNARFALQVKTIEAFSMANTMYMHSHSP